MYGDDAVLVYAQSAASTGVTQSVSPQTQRNRVAARRWIKVRTLQLWCTLISCDTVTQSHQFWHGDVSRGGEVRHSYKQK